MGYMLPKAIEIIANILERRGMYSPQKWHTVVIWLLAWAFIAAALLREGKSRRQKDQDSVKSSTVAPISQDAEERK